MHWRACVAGLWILAFLGAPRPGWTQESGPGGVAEISDAEAARLVAEAKSLQGEAYAANSRCKLEERYRAARRVHQISDALSAARKTAALQEVRWIMADLGAMTIRPECAYLVLQTRKPESYRSAGERAHGLAQQESYSALADRLHGLVDGAVQRCDLSAARNAYVDLESLRYDVNRLRGAAVTAAPDATGQIQAAIEHISRRDDAAYALLRAGEKNCEQEEANRGMHAARAAEVLSQIDRAERALSNAEAAKQRLDCEAFDAAVQLALASLYDLRHNTYFGLERPENVKASIEHLERLRQWNCREEVEKQAKEDILAEVDGAAPAAPTETEAASPWDGPSADSPWDDPGPDPAQGGGNEKHASTVAATPATPSTPGAKCVRWSGNGHRYELVVAPATWDEAMARSKSKRCDGTQGHLATIGSAEENAFLVESFSPTHKDFAWIAASDAANEASWRWVAGGESGQPLTYENWGGDEPNDSGDEDVAAINLGPPAAGNTGTGQWGDTKAWAQMPAFLVEFE